MTATTYTRGTKTAKITTAKLSAGTVVLTEDRKDMGEHGTEQDVRMAARKTGATLRTVESLEAVMHPAGGYYRRAQRTYTVRFTDGTQARGNAPSTTWDQVTEIASAKPTNVVTVDFTPPAAPAPRVDLFDTIRAEVAALEDGDSIEVEANFPRDAK
jgi:hypothetical protein